MTMNKGLAIKLLISFVLLLSLSLSLFNVTSSVVADDPIRTFPDSNLEAAIRVVIGVPEPDDIYQSNLSAVNTFVDDGGLITDLTGMEYWTSLVDLEITYSSGLSDVSNLSTLTSLTYVDLSKNNINDISPLSSLTSVTELFIQNNDISDISSLVGVLGSGDSLNVSSNPLNAHAYSVDIPSLQSDGVTVEYDSPSIDFPDANLEAAVRTAVGVPEPDPILQSDLDAVTSFTAQSLGIVDLTGMEYWTSLTSLIIDDNSISDISQLENLTSLTILRLSFNDIVDISYLSGLTNLIELSIGSNSIEDISSIAALVDLTNLRIGDNSINDISSIAALTSLTNLDIQWNDIVDISVLEYLTNLQYLTISNNNIVDISPLDGLPISQLYAGSNNIIDMSYLNNSPSLTYINLDSNNVSVIPDLSGITSIGVMSLSNNHISDLSKLANMSSLNGDLWLDNNEISDISPIIYFTSLDRIGLSGNNIEDISIFYNMNSSIPLYYRFEDNCIVDLSPFVGVLESGDELRVSVNPLDVYNYDVVIPALEIAGVYVTCDPDPRLLKYSLSASYFSYDGNDYDGYYGGGMFWSDGIQLPSTAWSMMETNNIDCGLYSSGGSNDITIFYENGSKALVDAYFSGWTCDAYVEGIFTPTAFNYSYSGDPSGWTVGGDNPPTLDPYTGGIPYTISGSWFLYGGNDYVGMFVNLWFEDMQSPMMGLGMSGSMEFWHMEGTYDIDAYLYSSPSIGYITFYCEHGKNSSLEAVLEMVTGNPMVIDAYSEGIFTQVDGTYTYNGTPLDWTVGGVDPPTLINSEGGTSCPNQTIAIVSTNSVTNISEIGFIANGSIVELHGGNATRVGFCYMEGASGNPNVNDNFEVHNDGDFGVGTFERAIGGLSSGKYYIVKAYALDYDGGISYGFPETIKTISVSPETFNSSCNWSVPSGVYSVEVLVVAGGGGGGGGWYGGGGGGGGGGTIYNSSYGVIPGEEISIIIGDGGAGGVNASLGVNGSDSIFGNITATGGGGGGFSGYPPAVVPGHGGLDGGSGGGGSGGYAATDGGYTIYPPSQGYNGGAGSVSYTTYGGGGGGGAGGDGVTADGSTNGDGGIGYHSNISGIDTGYAGGGGGGVWFGPYDTSSQGVDGGGNGGSSSAGDGGAWAPTAGGINTGGGGGGADRTTYTAGASGGSGIVIVNYLEDYVVTFNDSNLLSAVRIAVSVPSGDIYKHNLMTVSSFDANTSGIVNLSGMQEWTSLTNLNLSYNSIVSVSYLDTLTSLSILHLSNNSISDISPLVGTLSTGAVFNITGNVLNHHAYSTDIPALEGDGVTVYYDPEPVWFPSQPINPHPANGESMDWHNANLNWDNCSDTGWYDVYLNTSYPPTYIGHTNSTSYQLFDLTYSDIYYWKVVANNEHGNTSSDIWSFTVGVAPPPPTGLTATALTNSRIYLEWTPAIGVNGTAIRRSTGGYPATTDSGTLVYFGNASSCYDNELNVSTRYYYRAWSYELGSINYSVFYDDAYATTYTGGQYTGPAVPIIVINTSPGWWYGNLSCLTGNIPFQAEFITAANKIGCSPCVLITAAAVAITMAVSVGVFLFVGSIALAFIVGLGMLVGAMLTGAVPLWILLVYALLGVSTYYVLRRA